MEFSFLSSRHDIRTSEVLMIGVKTYSQYKGGNTFKLLVGIMATGAITFVSKLHNGAISGLHITKCSGLIDIIVMLCL